MEENAAPLSQLFPIRNSCDNGNLQKLQYPGSSEEYTYYPNNRLHTLANKLGSTIIEAYNYSYDPAGNQTSKLDGKGTTAYTYDELNRLLTVTEPGGKETSYTYDAAGNRATETVTTGGTGITTTYTYNTQNRLIYTEKQLLDGSAEVVEYTYDNNGNMLSQLESVIADDTSGNITFGLSLLGVDSVTNDAIYEYDTRNRLIRVTQGAYVVENTYNGEGLRVAKTVNGDTLRYFYEYDRIILETDENGTETARNIFGTNLVSRTVTEGTLHIYTTGTVMSRPW
jgi:YD repeat-containing protein